ncbi:Endoglucanase 25 [Vigna angularis]|uniref:Endoglucanase n=1 Tax=Phaseolus angularis TaxID=3914 RepID=A0A8T0KL26_PHAAN|nr:Endoglucanase 25 [Vigna angularis]
MPPAVSSTFESERDPVIYVHTVSEAGRLLPSASRWNSIAVDIKLAPDSSTAYESIPSQYPKSVDYDLVITNRKHFHSGHYPRNSPVKFRGDSGLQDGNSANTDLTGGFYDSGNNIKFTFTTAYTMTLLSWTVMEYQSKYADIDELDHVRDIIRWGSDYLLKVGSTISINNEPNELSCWQRPEDMKYERSVSICDGSATDLVGEIVAALSAASMVFKEDRDYSKRLKDAAERVFGAIPTTQGTHTMVDACGKQATMLYNSTSYQDELAWGATWLFLATTNTNYLAIATETFFSAKSSESSVDKGVVYWNNKLNAVEVLLTGIRYFRDPGFPYEDVLILSSNSTDALMCSYLFNKYFSRTPGGLIILKPDNEPLLQFAATASFLSKLYSDYLDHLKMSSASCKTDTFSVKMLRDFATSQAVNYILGQNPLQMSYLVGYGDRYPVQVHHRSASIPWNNQPYNCDDGKRWLNSKDPNPQVLLGAMVGGPDANDNFLDQRTNQKFTEPSIASNAGLVAALIALQDPPYNSRDLKSTLWGWT